MNLEPFPWELNKVYVLARANYMACAYNAAVNSDTSRGIRKMRDLIHAINLYERVEGAAKLAWLQSQGVIGDWKPCPPECEVRPGGLFHARDCENDSNHPVSRARRDAAREKLPERFKWAAWPSLVGDAL